MGTVKVVSVVQFGKFCKSCPPLVPHDAHYIFKAIKTPAVKKHTELAHPNGFQTFFFLSQFLLWKPV